MAAVQTTLSNEDLLRAIGLLLQKEEEEPEPEEEYERLVTNESDLLFAPGRFFKGVDFRTMITNPNIMTRRFLPTSIGYTQQLQYCLTQARLIISQNQFNDMERMKEEMETLRKENYELKKQLGYADGLKSYNERTVKEVLDWQTAKGRRNQVAVENGLEPTERDVSENQNRSGSRFASVDGLSKKEKQKLCAAHFEAGYRPPAIAQMLGVSESTVKAYISTMSKHWNKMTLNGNTNIVFDEEYDSDTWDLSLYSPNVIEAV